MGYFEDEVGFYEPSEYDVIVDEFKKTLRESVKKEYQEEMAKLKAENAELQDVKKNMESMKSEHWIAMKNLEFERQDLINKVRRERLSKLMEEKKVILYKVKRIYENKPKCDNCDDDRLIRYKTPRGKDAHEYCECAEKYTVHVPEETILYEFRLDRDNKEFVAFYRMKEWTRDEDFLQLEENSTLHKGIYKEGDDFTNKYYKLLFETHEQCYKYCEELNKLEKDR